MNDRHPNAPGGANDQDWERTERQAPQQQVQGPTNALQESALAVDLAGVEFDRLIATAHKFPRRLDVTRQQLEQIVCFDEASAENAVYALPRGDKPIVGPSIGFANALASAYGNCWDDGRWLYTDRREKIVVGGGVFVDWQSNRRTTVSVQRRICNKDGRLYNDDMIVVTSSAAAAIARRNAILAGVPRPLWFPIYEKALFIMRGTEATLPERRDQALKSLAAFGVKPEQVFMYLGVRMLKEVGVEHIPTLRGMFTQLRDGTVSPAEMFDPRRMTNATFDKVENPLGSDVDEETGEVTDNAPGGERQGSGAANGQRPAGDGTDNGQGGAGEGRGQGSRPQQDSGPADGAQAATAGPGNGKPDSKPKPKPAGNKKPDPKPAAAKPEPKVEPEPEKVEPTGPPLPTTPEGYEAYCLAWVATQTSGTAAKERWKSERDLRTGCRVVEDVFDRCKKALDAKVAELGG